jgi:ParB-like chromosome segregation protein Spo0J
VSVEVDEDGRVLDGKHRLRACIELGKSTCPTVLRRGLNEEDKRKLALNLNLLRRHLTQEQRRQLVEQDWTGFSLEQKSGSQGLRARLERSISYLANGQLENVLLIHAKRQLPAIADPRIEIVPLTRLEERLMDLKHAWLNKD